MNFYYYSFNEYRKLDEQTKSNFLFLSTAYTTPSYWNGQEFKPFVPSKDLFLDACQNFSESNYEERYLEQLNKFDRIKVINYLKKLSNNKDIVFLVWEAENKPSERDLFIPWLTQCSKNDIKFYSFLNKLKIIQNENLNVLNI